MRNIKFTRRSFRLKMMPVITLLIVAGFGGIMVRCANTEGANEDSVLGSESAPLVSTPVNPEERQLLGLVSVSNYRDSAYTGTSVYMNPMGCSGAIISPDWVITGKSSCWTGSTTNGVVHAVRYDGATVQRAIVAGVRLQDSNDISIVQLAPGAAQVGWPPVNRLSFSGATSELLGREISCYGANKADWSSDFNHFLFNSWVRDVSQVDSTSESEFALPFTNQGPTVTFGSLCFLDYQLAGFFSRFSYPTNSVPVVIDGSTVVPNRNAHYIATNPFAKDIADIISPPKTIVHAPNGSFEQSHEDTYVSYISDGGEHWCAKIHGNTFVHAKDCNFAYSHSAAIIKYKSWDNASWTAKINGNTFTHAPGGDFTRAHTDTILNYQSNGANWTMKLK